MRRAGALQLLGWESEVFVYGMVNRAVRDMVLREHGEPAWRAIRLRAGVEHDDFVGMSPYPDEVTYALVAAASAHLGVAPATVLDLFGEYWISYSAREGYGSMLDLAGSDFVSFLRNLDELHVRTEMMFPEMRPPRFRLREVGDDSLVLVYASDRDGLEPFVVGLLRGLGKRFEISVEATLVTPRASTEDEAEFHVRRVEGPRAGWNGST